MELIEITEKLLSLDMAAVYFSDPQSQIDFLTGQRKSFPRGLCEWVCIVGGGGGSLLCAFLQIVIWKAQGLKL